MNKRKIKSLKKSKEYKLGHNSFRIYLKKPIELSRSKNKLFNLSLYSKLQHTTFLSNDSFQISPNFNNTEYPDYFLKNKKLNLSGDNIRLNLRQKMNDKNKFPLSVRSSSKNVKQIQNCIKMDPEQKKKERLKSKINIIDKSILSLEKKLNYKKRELLTLKIEIEKKNYENKLIKLKEQNSFIIQKHKNKIKSLKIKLFKCEKKYINLKKFNDNLYNEDLIFQNKKIKLLDKLIEFRSLLSNYIISNDNNNEDEYSKTEKDYSIEEKSITFKQNFDYGKFDSLCESESFLDTKINEDVEYKIKYNKIEIFKSKFLENIKK
jgi:hypothetical protein